MPLTTARAPRARRWPPLACLLASILLSGPVAAEPAAQPTEGANDAKAAKPAEHGFLTLQFDNDLFGRTDRHFTHGTRFAWLSPPGAVPGFVAEPIAWLPPFEDRARLRAGFSLGQNIFTPTDIERKEPDPDDQPYAGWLYAGFGVVAEGDGHLDNLELDLGLIGP